jgi:REP element-mobilizing transposase RayT
MPRQARIAVPGVIYHVTARGNNRNRIIHDDGGGIATCLSICDPTKRKGVRLCQQT